MRTFSGPNVPLNAKIIGVFYEVYNELGFGFLESVYREAMRIALVQDLVVEGLVVVELKTADSISKPHEAQLLHYLRASPMEIGLVMNFGPDAKFRRVVMQNARKGRMPAQVPQQS